MKNFLNKYKFSSHSGIAPIFVLLFIFAFLGLLLGLDYGYVYFLNRCGDTPLGTCITQSSKINEEKTSQATEKKTLVTAKGSFSVKKYGITVLMSFPLEGGAVTGKVSGTCDATVTGTYKGGDSGAISGKVVGSCSPFFVPIPAKATFTGTVNNQQKTVPITGTGGAAGFSGSGSITLTY